MTARTCPGCGNALPDDDVMCSVSHTIVPGGLLCSDCGRKETLDRAWAEGRRIGQLRAEAARDGHKRGKEAEAPKEQSAEICHTCHRPINAIGDQPQLGAGSDIYCSWDCYWKRYGKEAEDEQATDGS